MITIYSASLLTFVYIALSFLVIRGRIKYQIGYGMGPKNEIAGLVSAHGNFAAYVPLFLILLYLYELKVGSTGLVMSLAGVFSLVSISHLYGLVVAEKKRNLKFRQFGMVCTFFPLLILAVAILF